MKIGLCGTMSVGKTTLVNALKELPEFKDYTFTAWLVVGYIATIEDGVKS
jgi:GTPase SAR1 family protein